MSKKIGAIDFSAECRRLLKEYGDEVHETINELVPDAADIAVKMIRRDSKKRTGAYAKGWSKKMIRAWGFGVSYSVYNRTKYRVAHLLENPHVIKNKKGTYGTTAGDGVIAFAEEYTDEWIESELLKRLGGD